MPDPVQGDALPPDHWEGPSPDSAVEVFYDRTLSRIRRLMAVIGGAASIVITILFGWRMGIGVLFGSIVSWANFVWLKQSIDTIADAAALQQRSRSGKVRIGKSVLRYALIGVAAYVIFLVSRQSLYGFLGGLFVAVAAILCEAAYEAFVALRRGL